MESVNDSTLLAYILSFTSVSDTLSVILTCRLWCFVAFRRKTRSIFWKKRVCDRLFALGSKVPFDTFVRPLAIDMSGLVNETIREQVEWIFRREGVWTITEPLIFRRLTHTNMVMLCEYDSKMSLLFTEYGVCINGSIISKGPFTLIEEQCDSYKLYWIKNETIPLGNSGMIKFECWDGLSYSGQYALDEDQNLLAHGNGRWTFLDGSTLEGKGVAWYGEPRKPVKKIKWE